MSTTGACRCSTSTSIGSSTRPSSHNIGFDDYFARGGVVVVEWADRFVAALPAERLTVRIEIADGDARRLHVDGPARLASALQ